MKMTLMDELINEDQIFVISPAIDTDFFKPNCQQGVSDVLQIVTVARLHWKKGLEYTLEALALLKKQNQSFIYTIIGEGDQYERLVFAAHQLGITDEVKFLGKLTPQEVKTQLNWSDIYLQYSIQEGFCNAVLEAQSMGLLCIVSNADGLDENVLNNVSGWVIPKRNPKALADKIIEVKALASSDQETIRKSAMLRVRDSFTLKNQRRLFKSFYG